MLVEGSIRKQFTKVLKQLDLTGISICQLCLKMSWKDSSIFEMELSEGKRMKHKSFSMLL